MTSQGQNVDTWLIDDLFDRSSSTFILNAHCALKRYVRCGLRHHKGCVKEMQVPLDREYARRCRQTDGGDETTGWGEAVRLNFSSDFDPSALLPLDQSRENIGQPVSQCSLITVGERE